MMIHLSVSSCFAVTLIAIIFQPPASNALGSGSTVAVSYGTATVCAVVAAQSTRRILCYNPRNNALTPLSVQPNVSFSSVAAGRSTLCGLRAGGQSLLCWNTADPLFSPKRVYFDTVVSLRTITIGDDQICATSSLSSSSLLCWRETADTNLGNLSYSFEAISSGFGFTCGISAVVRGIHCWGSNPIASRIEQEFGNTTLLSISAGASHVCGLNSTGLLVCKGENSFGQLNVPANAGLEFAPGLAMAERYSCAVRRSNGTVVCWGGLEGFSTDGIAEISFELIVSGTNFTCGLTSSNLSIVCFGPGWNPNSGSELPLSSILPGPCVNQSSCFDDCGIYPDSNRFCSSSEVICKPCLNIPNPPPQSPPPFVLPPPPSSPSKAVRRGLLVLGILGSVGTLIGICTALYCMWTGVCFGKKKVHNSVQPTITRGGSNSSGGRSGSNPPSRSATFARQGSRMLTMLRQRSGTSSKRAERAEEFSLAELADATNDFSASKRIGAGSFGVVYKGKLVDGREVAIKRGDTGQKKKKYQEKENAFESELAFLSRLHHKHLVKLIGYCEEQEERLLVYEYMKNGALHDHLHDKNNVDKTSSMLNSWKMRIKIAVDAARGIEYLHSYAVPSIIHRDIKSSNILLDANWTARVSDFGLSMLGPDGDRTSRPMSAAGTVGYIDPEYYGLNVLTAKSDIYGFGVVMLELLTGKRAIFKDEDDEGTPVSLVDFAVPVIMAGELFKVLDKRVGMPTANEVEAVELMAYTAMHCVQLEGKDRPTISDIVANLERALALSEDSHGSISSDSITILSD